MSPRVTPKNRIPDIVSAAIRVFSRKAYRLTQMEEIAKEANISKATLYYYFESKIHLFRYVLENGDLINGDNYPPPKSVSPVSEEGLLRIIRKQLSEGAKFTSIDRFLEAKKGDVDISAELREILEELWDICERNRIQILLLERSADEFPELAKVYNKYARRHILEQFEKYLINRISIGAMRPVESVPAVARFAMETISWFGWKQFRDHPKPPFPKSKTLPDLVSVIVGGLKK